MRFGRHAPCILAMLLFAIAPARTVRASVHVTNVVAAGQAYVSAAGGSTILDLPACLNTGAVWNGSSNITAHNADYSNFASDVLGFGWDPTLGASGGFSGTESWSGVADTRGSYYCTCRIEVTGVAAAYQAGYAANTNYAAEFGARARLVSTDDGTTVFAYSGVAATQLRTSGSLPTGHYRFDAWFSKTNVGPSVLSISTGAFVNFTGYGNEARITSPPTGRVVILGPADSTLTLSAGATGSGTPALRWSRNGTPLSDGGGVSGSATGTLVISGFSTAWNGAYACMASNATGADTSDVAVCEAGAVSSAPLITLQPEDQLLDSLGNVLAVRAFASGPLTYQWSRGGVALGDGAEPAGAIVSGAQAAVLVLSAPTSDDAGDYQCLVTDTFGSTSTRVARVGAGTTAVDPAASGPLRLAAGPNPAQEATGLSFALPTTGRVRLDVYDVAGRHVAMLADGVFGAGPHRVAWDLRDTAGARVRTGLYLARLSVGGASAVRRVVVVE